MPEIGISGHADLLSNPDFIFPGINVLGPVPAIDEHSSSVPTPSSLQPTRREPTTLSARRGSAHALPNFVFNPSASSSSLSPTTPPHSPRIVAPATPPRIIGHRRGGSEYVGGDGNGGGGLKSASPTKSEAALPVPSTAGRYGPPAGRRGHAHRRSAAMSSHDLSDIVKPKDPPSPPARHGSAPVSPVESFWSTSSTGHRSESLSSVISAPSSSASKESESPKTRAVPRVRVGFSERVEYIRPLSTISSETESSISTIRHGGHSVSGSFSSLLSAGSPSPQSSRVTRGSLQAAFEDDLPASRSNIAESSLAESYSGDPGSDDQSSPADMLGDVSSSTSPSQSCPLSNQPPLSPLIEKPLPAKTKLRSLLSHRRSESSLSPTGATFCDTDVSAENQDATATSLSKIGSAAAKQPKTRTWSGLMSRKAKSQEFRSRSEIKPCAKPDKGVATDSPEPSPCSTESFTPDFDEDNTITIVSDDAVPAGRHGFVPNNRDSVGLRSKDADCDTGAMIDLDVAEQPAATVAGNAPGSARSAAGFANARRRMRSGGGGLSHSTSLDRLHRRAESAPEMAPFEAKHSAIAMNSIMADVFEEDEEYETTAAKNPSELFTRSTTEPIERPATAPTKELCDGISKSDRMHKSASGSKNGSRDFCNTTPQGKHRPVGLAESRQVVSEPLAHSKTINGSFLNTVEVVEDHEEPRAGSINRSSDSTISALVNDDTPKKQDGTVDLTINVPPPPLMTPDSFTPSSFSSPDFARSQASFDTPRLGTAASSMTDQRMPGTACGSIGELRMSTDDVPSLTSSRSTATTGVRNSLPALRSRYVEDQRSSGSYSQSISSEQRSKRSSIASLSRLVSGSFTERSKLSIEQTTQPGEQQQQQLKEHQQHEAEPIKEARTKRTKRLSRLMGFWKSKERLRP